ncbi:RagB/SusD family nutrient uptake outer membrane protein [Sphingobacterium sp. CZ-2]|uniref:RagB/SusD family nutrient uptake outer membrane protein n=1 Tax=Sphingobacterium sp. CZ-2 TaxID=2557994 RepID=UPI0010706609|nr:RagB/SusD family nutrient uptake outer membrane protein [Sphingobacterium sp. CZ-2]QBR12983.1 RagB/SusD family nutrient uptake outer membrane protein [Sphingobacterium sp. CZ-2]
MKIKSLITYICCAFIIVNFSACKKYIDLEPENSTYDEVFWTDANNIPKANAGAYSMLRDALRLDRSFFIFGDLAGGNFVTGGDYWNYKDLSKGGNFKFGYAPYLEGSLWNWTRFYAIVNQCNLIIEKTPALPADDFPNGETEKNQLIAEARFIRAYTNFYMQRVWGDILLIKESYKDPQNIPPIARSPLEETMAFCIDDLLFGIDNLPTTGSKAKASKGAAQALLAHVYAWKHDYVNAEKYANDVLSAGYSLESTADYRKIWAGNSKESIWELSMLYNTSGEEHSQGFFNAFLADPAVPGKSVASAWTFDQDVLEDVFTTSERGARFDSIATRGANDQTYFLRKYDNFVEYPPKVPGGSYYAISNNLVLLRLADLRLLHAEAALKNGKPQVALADLNIIRKRAGISELTSAGSDLMIEIFKERRRELIGEGSTQFDLIRMEMFNKIAEFSAIYSADRLANQGYFWPLNMRALLPQNELLTQNPWWIKQ